MTPFTRRGMILIITTETFQLTQPMCAKTEITVWSWTFLSTP